MPKSLYIVKDIPESIEDCSSYSYIVKAENEKEAVDIAKNNMSYIIRKWKWEAQLADNTEIWE